MLFFVTYVIYKIYKKTVLIFYCNPQLKVSRGRRVDHRVAQSLGGERSNNILFHMPTLSTLYCL